MDSKVKESVWNEDTVVDKAYSEMKTKGMLHKACKATSSIELLMNR